MFIYKSFYISYRKFIREIFISVLTYKKEEESDVILDDTQDKIEDKPRRRRPQATTD